MDCLQRGSKRRRVAVVLVLLVLAMTTVLVNGAVYARSADARLMWWRRRGGIRCYRGFAFAELSGRRVRTPDLVVGSLRKHVTATVLGLLFAVALVMLVCLRLNAPTWVPAALVTAIFTKQLDLPRTLHRAMDSARLRSSATGQAVALVVAATWLLLAGVVLIWLAMVHQSEGTPWPMWLAETGAAYAALVVAARVSRRARRWVSMADVLASDAEVTRNDVLFLRSFNDDDIRIQALDFSSGVLGLLTGSTVRFEELVASPFAEAGRTIAIGRPGEKLPELGSLRMYVSDEEWQDVVARVARQVGCIHLVAGSSEGLGWEVSHLKELGLLRKTLIFLPPLDEADAWTRVHTILRQLDLGFADTTSEDGPWLGVVLRTLTAIGVTETDQPVFYVSDRRDWIAYTATLSAGDRYIRGSLEPPMHGVLIRQMQESFPLTVQ